MLAQIGLSFKTLAPEIDESVKPDELPMSYVGRMAQEKYEALQDSDELALGDVLLTADTVVVCAGQILGKPVNESDAAKMLTKLSDTLHSVFTGVTVGKIGAHNQQFIVETKVHFRRLSNTEIAAYWQTGEPQDKAGAYGIQGIGGIFVKQIEGSYSNVVGLPMTETAEALSDFGITVLE